MKKNTIYIILAVVAIIALVWFFGMKKEGTDITTSFVGRTFSKSTVAPGEQFTVTYTASASSSATWGVLITDVISGGCMFYYPTSSSATLNYGWLSSASPLNVQSYTQTVTAMGTAGTCNFTGNYQFSSNTVGSQKAMTGSSVVTVALDCTGLKATAVTAINAWMNDPTSTKKTAALNAINAWASGCSV